MRMHDMLTFSNNLYSFLSLRAEYDDQLKHDFALHKVFLHLCPNEGTLLSVIQRTLPIIGISYVIVNFKEQDINESKV